MFRYIFINILFFFFLPFMCVAEDSFSYAEMVQKLRYDELIVSNYPERIKTPGLVIDKTITSPAIRIMYHHRSAVNTPFFVNMLLSNWGLQSATVNVVTGLGGSSEDIVFSGHIAMSKFMTSLKNGGKNIQLLPGESKQIVFHKIKFDQTVSGLVRVERGDSDLLNLKMQVIDMGYPSLSGGMDVPNILGRFKYGEFENSFIEQKHYYQFEKPIYIMSVGGTPYVKDTRTGLEIKGNYAVMYYITLTVKNPLEEDQGITLFLSPVKQQSVDRGVILLDGELIETDVLTYNKKGIKVMQSLKHYTIKAKQSLTVQLMMMPQAGVFYPVDIVLRKSF